MTKNPLRALRAMGYVNVLPATQPGVTLHPKSNLANNLAGGRDERGKAPGYWWSDQGWGGIAAWESVVATERDLDRWFQPDPTTGVHPGAGLRTGDGVFVLDIDATEEALANDMEADALASFGPAPCRVGKWPKRALVYRIDGSLPYATISYERAGQEALKPEERQNDHVEFSAGKRFMVMHGTHQKTGKPYWWHRPLVPFDKLTHVSTEQIDAYKARWAAKLPAAVLTSQRPKSVENLPPPATLLGSEAVITAAVNATPNTRAMFPTYASMIVYGEALHAASGGAAWGLELWHVFCSDWEGGDYSHDVTEARWRTFDFPHSIGASYICSRADIASGKDTQPFTGALYHETVPEPAPSLFKEEPPVTPDGANAPIRWVRPSEWSGKTPPEREWEVAGWIPRYEVTLLYGDGGIGKTLVIHQYATAAAAGVSWLGQPTRRAKVMCFFCEDSEDELLRRQIDINANMGLSFEDTDEHLRIASRKYMDNLLILWDRNTGAMKRQAVWEQLRNDAVAFGAEVIVVDTIADTFGGNEIDRGQVNAFVKSCLGRLAQEIGGTVIALGHPSLSGKASGSGTSGSTAWSNAVRSRLYLRYPKGVEKGNIRELEGMKLNYGPKGNLIKLRWNQGAFEVIAATTAPVGESLPNRFESSEGVPTVEGAADAVVFDALQAVVGAGPLALNLKPTSINYAPKALLRREPEMLAGLAAGEIEEALSRLERLGCIAAGEVGRDASRRPIIGYSVVRMPGLAADKLSDGVFD